mgnify:CR=1 FL=1
MAGMKIHVARNGSPLGEFDEEAIADSLRLGFLKPTDHYFVEGMTEWQLLAEFSPSKPST